MAVCARAASAATSMKQNENDLILMFCPDIGNLAALSSYAVQTPQVLFRQVDARFPAVDEVRSD